MPMFMDTHEDLALSPEVISKLTEDARAAAKDDFGVSQVDLFYNSGGKVYCLLDGPDEQAVRDHHAALGVPCGDVDRVQGLDLA